MESAAENENEDSALDDSGINSSRRSSTSSKSGKLTSPGKSREKKRKLESENVALEDGEFKKGKPSNSLDSDTAKSSPEVMSRSGRKIKPKRFADFEGNKSESPEKNDTEDLSEEMKEDFIVFEVNDEKIEIPLKLNRPSSIDQKNINDWDIMVCKYAMTLKKRLEAGETLPISIEKHMDEWTKEKLKTFEAVQEDREQKIAQLKVETQLLDIDTRIKSSLSLNKADPDKCLQLMDEVLELNINALMLKKHPEVVETVKKMRKYVGNTTQWSMTDEQLLAFNSKASMIRSKAEHVYNKFKSMFLVPNGKSFWEIFAKELDAFNKKTENMSMEAVFSMVHEPE
ncbi:hypothetical protein AAG570_003554 [Ranatra chinensis]|uniref:Lens epithelium-derived growth factor integrase-binding domain-containing protein n=1 Tax=Ranatra chinensis TaxID=642074 RepID=A0ABD0Y685_9HEMI